MGEKKLENVFGREVSGFITKSELREGSKLADKYMARIKRRRTRAAQTASLLSRLFPL